MPVEMVTRQTPFIVENILDHKFRFTLRDGHEHTLSPSTACPHTSPSRALTIGVSVSSVVCSTTFKVSSRGVYSALISSEIEVKLHPLGFALSKLGHLVKSFHGRLLASTVSSICSSTRRHCRRRFGHSQTRLATEPSLMHRYHTKIVRAIVVSQKHEHTSGMKCHSKMRQQNTSLLPRTLATCPPGPCHHLHVIA